VVALYAAGVSQRKAADELKARFWWWTSHWAAATPTRPSAPYPTKFWSGWPLCPKGLHTEGWFLPGL